MPAALYLITHEPDTDPVVDVLTVTALWHDRLVVHSPDDMLSVLTALHDRGVARDPLTSRWLVLGSADLFRDQLGRWVRATVLEPDDRQVVLDFMHWPHPLGSDPQDAAARALWDYLVDHGQADLVRHQSPDAFLAWMAADGYSAVLVPWNGADPVPDLPDGGVAVDPVTQQAFRVYGASDRQGTGGVA